MKENPRPHSVRPFLCLHDPACSMHVTYVIAVCTYKHAPAPVETGNKPCSGLTNRHNDVMMVAVNANGLVSPELLVLAFNYRAVGVL